MEERNNTERYIKATMTQSLAELGYWAFGVDFGG
jgi:hypothetical protein